METKKTTARKTMTKAEFAAAHGVTPSRVSHWIDEGKLSGGAIVGEGRSARINVAVADAQLARRLDQGQALGNGRRPDDAADDEASYAAARRRQAVAQAEAIELRNLQLRGTLIVAADAEKRWSDEMIALRSRMLRVAGDLPLVLQHLTPHDVSIIDREIRAAMTEAAGV